MSIPVPTEPEPETNAPSSAADLPPVTTPETDSPDPITGEPGAHPVAVGVGALSAGMAGAAIGAFAGPIGMLVGAAIGAVAGGLTGHEAAVTTEENTATMAASEPDRPLPTASSGLITPEESSVFADSSSADSGVTGEAPLLTESALPAAFATSAAPEETLAKASPVYATHADTEHTIRTAAYYRYLDREAASEPGSDFEDWITAEKEVLRS